LGILQVRIKLCAQRLYFRHPSLQPAQKDLAPFKPQDGVPSVQQEAL
jgi:hypothetical protein